MSPLVTGGRIDDVAAQIDAACRTDGFFTIVGHGIDPQSAGATGRRGTCASSPSTRTTKAEVAMARGGRAWRGWFPLGGELTAGVPDVKEGLLLRAELAPDDPRVVAGTLLHGPNLFPAEPAELRRVRRGVDGRDGRPRGHG